METKESKFSSLLCKFKKELKVIQQHTEYHANKRRLDTQIKHATRMYEKYSTPYWKAKCAQAVEAYEHNEGRKPYFVANARTCSSIASLFNMVRAQVNNKIHAVHFHKWQAGHNWHMTNLEVQESYILAQLSKMDEFEVMNTAEAAPIDVATRKLIREFLAEAKIFHQSLKPNKQNKKEHTENNSVSNEISNNNPEQQVA